MSFWDWLLARWEQKVTVETVSSSTQFVPIGPIGPYRGALQAVTEERKKRTVHITRIEGWPWRRQLRFARNVGFMTMITMALFREIWYLLINFIPKTELIRWTATASWVMPPTFARWLDIPASFIFGFGLALIGANLLEYQKALRENFRSNRLANRLIDALTVGSSAGLIGGLAFMITFGLIYILTGVQTNELTIGLIYGLGGGLTTGLIYGLSDGLISGLIVGLVITLLTIGLSLLSPLILLSIVIVSILAPLVLIALIKRHTPTST
ncbi:hypothetical protein KKF05_03710 [Patescibacteria group bacterium]|nr:hypothetical protein [Patescibacteria group bacterium]MBU1916384.1 hypothetical protein [Patescibacteria group bacterium]